MSKRKAVIKLVVHTDKTRSKAMQLASKSVGVNSVAITGEARDRLEVVGEGVDFTCLINRLRNKVCRADIVVVEEVKDKKKEEEEKKKKEEEEKKAAEEARKKAEEEWKKLWGACPPPPPAWSGGYYTPMRTFVCEEQPAAGCHVM